MLATLAFFSLLTVSGRAPTPQPAAFSYRPRIEVWTNRGDDPYASGQAARVSFRTEQDAYVTIFRVDTDGRVRVLYPREPWDDSFARGGRDYEVEQRSSRDAFYVDDYPGVGYIFAVAAADPFVYDAMESEDHWDYRAIADGRVRGDPYVALTDLAQRIVPDGYADWDYDIAPYYVQQHYDYPRFLCYDCHSYVSYPYWSPYDYTCVRFRIVVFDDPYYYPYRYYGGTRVVFTRPLRPAPRFIFKDRQGSSLFVTRVPQRPVTDDRRRDVGVRGRDLGGGSIPPPNIQPRQRPITGGGPPIIERPASARSPASRHTTTTTASGAAGPSIRSTRSTRTGPIILVGWTPRAIPLRPSGASAPIDRSRTCGLMCSVRTAFGLSRQRWSLPSGRARSRSDHPKAGRRPCPPRQGGSSPPRLRPRPPPPRRRAASRARSQSAMRRERSPRTTRSSGGVSRSPE